MFKRTPIVSLFLVLSISMTAWATHSVRVRALDTRTRAVVSYETIIKASSGADTVFVGEVHDVEWHHALQLSIIDGLSRKDRPLAVGLEMFPAVNQSVLDRWVNGGLSEEEMAQAFSENWGMSWSLYKFIFRHARENGIPMVALNAPRPLTRKVAANGFGALTKEDRKLLPVAVTCNVDRHYREFIRRVTQAHGAEAPEALERFCEAQQLWDQTMAWYVRDYLKRNPGARMVVLSGNTHTWRQGIPAHLNSEGDSFSSVVILPQLDHISVQTITPDDGDFVILGPRG